ncbi:MAG: sulfurtransferase TusA family protein [Desulfuromonas sp.]|nr:MAG: sulfurtransferase TusA family protein [Desulfuromonas sp.]
MSTVLDIRGQVCPSTLLVALREVNNLYSVLSAGERQLHILSDNRKAIMTIPAAVENMGLKAEVKPQEGHYLIVVSGGDVKRL